jgi:uncharacterized protein YwqG
MPELLEIAAEVGLEARQSEVRALTRVSVRLSHLEGRPTASAGQSRFGGVPNLGALDDSPVWKSEGLRFLAQLDLAEMSKLPQQPDLKRRGALWFFAANDPPSGLGRGDAGAFRVAYSASQGSGPVDIRSAWAEGRRIRPSAELVLPRVWSEPVQALELSNAERDAWQEVRGHLATSQGTASDDPAADASLAIHRLCGYPDERRGDMPLACELLARGLELGDDPPRVHPHAANLARHRGRWRMLLQLSADAELGWEWGSSQQRLYFWVDERDLTAGDFSRARAIVQ